MKRGSLVTVGSIVAALVIYLGLSIAASLNIRAGSYAYSAELPKPGISVDIRNDGAAMRAYIAWNRLYNSVASSAWKPPEGVIRRTERIAVENGGQIKCHVLEPTGQAATSTMLYCHGGAFFMPILPASLDCAAWYARALSCRVYMPEYRLTPANPYPVPVEDCYAALRHMASLPETDLSRVILYGESAGGCLCAEVMNRCLDDRLLDPAAQMLIYPVTDNAQHYESLTRYEDATWTRRSNLTMWKLYLNGLEPTPDDYAVPMLREDFSGFPPVYIEPAEMDTLCDQAVAYAEKLASAGVAVTERVVPGAYHGFDGHLDSPLVQQVLAERVQWLQEALAARPITR